jgi:hypothetical protein
MHLLRSIYTGTLQGLEPAEVDALITDSGVDFGTSTLARALRLVRGTDRGFPEWPVERLLDRALTLMIGSTNAMMWARDLPPGFGGDEAVYAIVYALVIGGRAEAAIDTLEAHLVQPPTESRDLKRAVVLQALRNIGSPRADELIRRAGRDGKDGNLPENLLADLHYPFHLDLASRWNLIPGSERSRTALRGLAGERCSERGAMATYLLGYLGTTTDEEVERAELEVLRESTRAPCFHTRYFAVRALALRSAETVAFWTNRMREERDAWQRAQLVRILWARFGTSFLQPALDLLAEEPSQYVQWELAHGNLEMRDGRHFRDYWDIWQTTTLQIRLTFPEGRGEARSDDMGDILTWLETGARPKDRVVRNHLLYGIGKHVLGINSRRLLAVFTTLPEKTREWWILAPITDTSIRPLLTYWQTIPQQPKERQALEEIIERLPGRRPEQSAACCEPTRACLIAQVERASADVAISNEAEATAWLRGSATAPSIAFLDQLERVASVRAPGRAQERWEHLFGCWRLVSP